MSKILVVYFSRGGNTEAMAKSVATGAETEGAQVEVKDVQDVSVDELPEYDGLIVGSPTYYGGMSGALKEMFDQSVKYMGKLEGKIGGAFTSAGNIGGGNETTVLSILQAMLIHGMIVQGSVDGDHYGPVAIGQPDARAREQCEALGQRVARLTKTMH